MKWSFRGTFVCVMGVGLGARERSVFRGSVDFRSLEISSEEFGDEH